MLAAVLCAAMLVLRGADRAFVAAVSILIGLSVLWILVSVLWPARADRTCPACGEAGLRRLNARSTRGVACLSCGHKDEEQSSFLLAEDDGDALETIRLEERSKARARGPASEDQLPMTNAR
jgi:hypothetical protein